MLTLNQSVAFLGTENLKKSRSILVFPIDFVYVHAMINIASWLPAGEKITTFKGIAMNEVQVGSVSIDVGREENETRLCVFIGNVFIHGTLASMNRFAAQIRAQAQRDYEKEIEKKKLA